MFSFNLKVLIIGAILIAGPLCAAVVSLNSKNFQTEVIDSKVPVILDAYTDWCHYCKGVAPVFAELSNEMAGKVKFAKLNIEAEPSIAGGLEIDALPTFLFYKNGKIVDRQAGALDKEGFKARFAKIFGN